MFSTAWPLDSEIAKIAEGLSSHAFLNNPASQISYVYLTQFVKAFSQWKLARPFEGLAVLDWGCGKGHVSKLLRDLGPAQLDSCDVLSESADSAFGQKTPILEKFNIQVKPLEHPYILPYDSTSFDVVLSFGVLEHVPNDASSLGEISRVLKPGGLFFCFFLPTDLSWTQRVVRNSYHDRLYGEALVRSLTAANGLEVLDVWYRQLLPKNSVHYPAFRIFEHVDQLLTEHTILRYFATNIEFVAVKSAGEVPLLPHN